MYAVSILRKLITLDKIESCLEQPFFEEYVQGHRCSGEYSVRRESLSEVFLLTHVTTS